MRRSSEELQQCYSMREIRAISNADGPGYLYAYVDGSIWKVGMSNDFVRRQKEWDKDCPCPWRIWFPPIRVANRRRVESLVHLLLEMQCLDRLRIYCPNCQRVHFEKFLFSEPWHIVWSTIGCYVMKTKRWVSVAFGAKRVNTYWLLYSYLDKNRRNRCIDKMKSCSPCFNTDIPNISVATRSDIPTSGMFRRFDVSTSVTSERSDVPTSGTHKLCEVSQKNLAIYMRRLLV
ncbi:uncharacterized protein C8R40DRAFT_1074639 [Lentinula edodes]|uniref:uncharacterized protein n=1 Tax=Lentinula edodes TaxID=5353 RepID=UPI001E8E59DB|nr:uncharacterized protein C8R40DRAFT_1074639 [Lentinula edodes]KAH7868669.1 hypothetical protein C8R40DRAFT_1074639 [Lentinula edodes]